MSYLHGLGREVRSGVGAPAAARLTEPITRAGTCSPFMNSTVTRPVFWTTCAAVRTLPVVETRTPEPSPGASTNPSGAGIFSIVRTMTTDALTLRKRSRSLRPSARAGRPTAVSRAKATIMTLFISSSSGFDPSAAGHAAASVAPEHGGAQGSSNRVPAWMGAPRSRSWTETQTRGVGKHDSKAMHVDGSALGPSSNLHGSPRALRISDPA